MVNKINKLLARLTKKKRERTQVNKIRSERGEITTNTTEIQQQQQKEYYEQLYAKKLDSLDEMDKFLERYSPPKLNQEEIGNLNRPVTRSEIEFVIKITPCKQNSRNGWLHWGMLSNIQRRTYTDPSQILPRD